MYRNVLLNFLISNKSLFEYTSCNQMTFVFLDFNQLDELELFKKDEVFVFHIKNQYTFLKKYDISCLKDSICEIALQMKKDLYINYNELTYVIKDPYYLKDLRKIDFINLDLKPIFLEEQIVGFGIFYLSSENKVDLSNNSLLKLKNKLELDFSNELKNDLMTKIYNDKQEYILVKNLINENIFCNENLRKYLRLSKNIFYKQEHQYKILTKFSKSMNKIVCDLNDESSEVYYMMPSLNKNKELEFYDIDSINYHGFEKFTLIFIKKENAESLRDFSLRIKGYLSKIYFENIFKFYKNDDNSLTIIIDEEMKKSNSLDFSFNFKKYYHQIVLSKEVYSSDLKDLVDYLIKELPEKFDFNLYSKTINKLNKEIFECDITFSNKEMIRIEGLEKIGEVIINPIKNYLNQAPYDRFEESSYKLMEKSLSNETDSLVFSVLITSLLKRKFYEMLKKIISTHKNAKLILHIPCCSDIDTRTCYENIAKIKELGFVLIADSTIFMNLAKNVCMRLIDAIIIRSEELIEPIYDKHDFNQAIFKTCYEDGKVVVFEEVPCEEDANMINSLTCLFIDKEEF